MQITSFSDTAKPPVLKVYLTPAGLVGDEGGVCRLAPAAFGLDALFTAQEPAAALRAALSQGRPASIPTEVLAPVGSQEVWAAGVTYQRSRTARVAESKDAGGGAFYDRVYDAPRPELFFKASPHRVAPSGGIVCIRADSKWNVPEPELTLALSARGEIFGYTVGNDMSSRDIEAENPLYLPQAKVYDRSAALGPCLLLAATPPDPSTEIRLEIRRAGQMMFSGATAISRIKRRFPELAGYLFRSNPFPHGCYLMTGTGIVPPDEFSLIAGDEIAITIEPIGTLINTVAVSP